MVQRPAVPEGVRGGRPEHQPRHADGPAAQGPQLDDVRRHGTPDTDEQDQRRHLLCAVALPPGRLRKDGRPGDGLPLRRHVRHREVFDANPLADFLPRHRRRDGCVRPWTRRIDRRERTAPARGSRESRRGA